MSDVMRGLTWNGIAIYLDDIIIGGRNFDEHVQLLKEVLSRLRNAGLTIKSSKVSLCKKTLRFLGHLVSIEGISPDPEKVDAVLNWPRPTTAKDVRIFLGLCNYYMEFMPNIQLVAKPLNELTGTAKFEWTAEREEAFYKLKEALTSAPVLAFPDMTRTFELSTDASDIGFGSILSQRDSTGQDRPIYYLSRTFSSNEINWHTRDKEAFALVYALRKFRHYLLGQRFTWHTDHLGLRWLRNTRDPRGRYAHWIEEIEEFEFETRYRAGKQNQHADALSRNPQQQNVNVASSSILFSAQDTKNRQTCDPVLRQVIARLRLSKRRIQSSNPVVLSWMRKKKNMFLDKETDILYMRYRQGRKVYKQLVVPNSLVPEVLQLKHDDAGHMSYAKTKKLIQRNYYWLTINEDTRSYCQSCSVCATCQDPPRKSTTKLTLTRQPTEPWKEVSMDLKGPFGPTPTPRGNQYLLVVLDLFTRAAEMIPHPNKKAKTVANAIITGVFCRHGIPESILTDRGLEFDNSTMLVLAAELGIDKKRISPLHPQANGAVERLNRTIGHMLKKTQGEDDLDWDLNIPFVRFNYLNQEHSSTGYSPFFLTYGRNPRTPVLVKESTMPKPKTPQEWAADLAKTFKEAHKQSTTRDMQQKQKRVEKSKEAPATQRYKINDKVLIYKPQKKGRASALHKPWVGPYIIIQCREGNTFRVKKADNFRKRFIRHHDQLRYFWPRPSHLCKQSQANGAVEPHKQPTAEPVREQPTAHYTLPQWLPPNFDSLDNDSGEESENDDVREPEVNNDEVREPEVNNDDVREPEVNGEVVPAPPEASRRSERQRREPQRYGEWVDSDQIMPLYSDIVKGLK